MKVEILKAFALSRDGITPERLERGSIVDIPDRFAPGLIKEGYVKTFEEGKELSASPENKMAPAVETLHPVEYAGDGHFGGNLPASERLDAAMISEAAALGVKVDRRWSAARLQAEIDKARG